MYSSLHSSFLVISLLLFSQASLAVENASKKKENCEAIASPDNKAPKYPFTERVEGIAGTTALEFYLDNLGQIVYVRIYKSSGNENLDKAALNAARKWKFIITPKECKKPNFQFALGVTFTP